MTDVVGMFVVVLLYNSSGLCGSRGAGNGMVGIDCARKAKNKKETRIGVYFAVTYG